MSSTKFRNADSIKPIPKMKSVKSFFAPMGNNIKRNNQNGKLKEEETKSVNEICAGDKRSASVAARKGTCIPLSKTKKPKSNPHNSRESIASFFSPKKIEKLKV